MSVIEKRIRKRLIDKELKPIDVARHFGWSSQYFSDLLRGRTAGPAAETNLRKVKDFLGVK